MILQLFGVMDILSGIVLGLNYFGYFKEIGLIFALYLLIKSIIFIKGFASWVDLLTFIVFLLVIYGSYGMWVWIFVLWLLQKGIFSFFH
ncbi:hypothetical protein HY498_03065 [Candidatus Woesearchaeota archaeon]|nr:hypothetical protein [Candidatus Woesearchaeota archaeon]